MQTSMNESFESRVLSQQALLGAGKPLEAFDTCFSAKGVMFSNDTLFATGATEARAKQEPFIAAAISISGLVTDLKMDIPKGLCVFRNKSRFTTADSTERQIDGLCWQKWHDGRIVEERYYDGSMMTRRIAEGVLAQPATLTVEQS